MGLERKILVVFFVYTEFNFQLSKRNTQFCYSCKQTNHKIDHSWALDKVIKENEDKPHSCDNSKDLASGRKSKSKEPFSCFWSSTKAGKTLVFSLTNTYLDSDSSSLPEELPRILGSEVTLDGRPKGPV